ncbi:uncharacterized protein LOC129915073 [Episyrphus balteatus]|uniref:uncharacterized protein LOC129915073 n=1 Tax=Episyrphus balteatus TaxID=286459 RepID=UPI0024868C93|nr:uncharacterized protein LOC129915073 [Episyrphus balteatus]
MASSFLFLSLSIVLAVIVVTLADESPGFFLKITKNIPRLGRRSDKQFGNLFFKNAKQIPRIGRRNEMENDESNSKLLKTLEEMSSPSKRFINPAPSTSREYSVVQPVNANTLIELIEKDAIPRDNIKFVHWKDFDRALQVDNDLYNKVVSLGRKPDRQLKEDLNFSRFMPFFGNSYQGDERLIYRGDGEMYSGNDKELLQYNEV